MIEKWGYRLPHYPTEKGERATYRAATKHCLIQDQSYIHCIEITATKHVMINNLNKLIPSKHQNSQLSIETVYNHKHSAITIYPRGGKYWREEILAFFTTQKINVDQNHV